MPVTKKHTTSKKIKSGNAVVVTKTKVPASKTSFSKKLEKVNALLSKSALLNS